jgi:carbamoyl-phosphate synthase large subunit
VAPALTLTDKEYQRMRDMARRIIRRVAASRRRIEHPVSRSTRGRPHRGDRDEPARLAVVGARVEGHRLPIAKIAAKLALGYHLDEIPNDITG